MGAVAFFRRFVDADAGLLRLARTAPMPLWRAVATGALWALAVLAVRGVASAFYGDISGFMILLPGVILASLAAGRIAGLTAVVACLGGGWLLVGLAGPGDGPGAINRIATVNFTLVGLFATVVAASLRKTLGRLDASVAALRASDARVDDSEERFRLVADNIPNLAWMAEPDGAIYWYNLRWYDYTGTTLEQMSGWGWRAVHDPAYVDGVTIRFKQCIETGEPWEDTFPLRAASGEWGWFLSRALPVRDAGGAIVRWFGTNTDITAQRQAQAALRESEERFRLMADTAPSPVWLTNEAGEVQFANAALVAFYGQPAEAFMGHAWKLAVHPDDMDDVAAAQAVARPLHQPYGFECRFRRFDGVWRWMRVSVNPRFEGAGPDRKGVFKGYVGLSFDITETREALDALARQEGRQTFLLSLTDRLHDMGSPDEVMSEVERALGDVLGADRVGYGELDSERGTISMSRDWTAGVSSVQGEFSLEALGADLIADLAEGRTISIADVNHDPRAVTDRQVFERLQARALIRVPLIRAGLLRAFIYVHSARPRDWTRAEVALVEEVAARTWIQIERTRAQVEVAESEARFRAIADTAPVLIWVTNQDGGRAFVNQAYVAFMGGDYESVRTADWRTYIHPDDQDRLVLESETGKATGEPFSLEARYRHHQGDYRWLKSFTRPRLGAGGEVLGFVGVAFDVTDIRESNARLAAIAAERDAILGQLAEGVIVTDPDGAIIFVNEAAARQHGVARLDVTPDEYAETYHLLTDDGRPYPPHELPLSRAVLHGETVTDARWRIRRPDGSEVIAVGNARPVTAPDGARIGAVLTLRDETARISAEHRLTESEARFRTVADSAPALIWMTDERARVVFANKRYKIFFDVAAEAVLGVGWKDYVHPEDMRVFSLTFLRAFKQKDRFEAVMRVQHPAMGLRWLRSEGVPRFDASGAFQGYVGASLDITDAKRAEDDLKRINELLEERVGEALAEKAKAEADLMHAQRMEAVGRLTGGVAHDFNNLLTVVIGALDMILRSPDDAARRKKLGEAALAAARRGESLTHQLLAFSRRQALRPEPVDLNALIREGEPLLRRAVGEAVEFRLKLRRGGARVSVDPAQFEAAMLNLIVNARDAVGGRPAGRITIQTLNCEVHAGEVIELPAGPYVCIAVSDNGAGMDAATMTRVFEPFFTTKAVGKGTGLGLSQVYGFARQSGGGVRLSSTVGRGTEIRLFLPPLDASETITPEAPRPEIEAIPPGRRLLLVEDDVSVAAVAMELLQGLGLEVVAVESGPQALEVLSGARFDVMLSDVVMPGGMTGIVLARHCADRYPAMRILLTSGYAGDDVDEALSDAPWPFLRKPYSGDQLRQALGELLPPTED